MAEKIHPMKSILIPTDFSENARHAAKYAISLFGKKDVKYYLFHAFVIPHRITEIMVSSLRNTTESDAMKDLEKEVKWLVRETQIPRAKLDMVARFGKLVDTLQTYTDSNPVDYVVMGTQGASGIKEMIMGSNTYSVIQRINLPTIAVPEVGHFQPPRKIAMAVNAGIPVDREKCRPLIEIAKAFNAHLTFFTVNTEENGGNTSDLRLKLKDIFKGIDHNFVSLTGEDPTSSIERFLRLEPIDLLILLPRKTNFFSRLFKKSVTRNIAFHGKIPLLTLP